MCDAGVYWLFVFCAVFVCVFFFFSSRRRHTRSYGDWSSDVCSSDLGCNPCAPVIYGPPDRMDYILESMGCGVAFLDYDNDGWLDIFLLSGTHREGPVDGASNRLYKNNRDGTFADVTAKAGLVRQGWACGVTVGDYNNDGFEDLFI